MSQPASLIDTHCHLNFDSYETDREEVIARAAERGVTRIINPATDIASGAAALALADTHAGIYAAVGIHPNSTEDYTAAHLATLETQAQHPKAKIGRAHV